MTEAEKIQMEIKQKEAEVLGLKDKSRNPLGL